MMKFVFPFLFALIAAPALAPLQAQPVDGGHARVGLISERETAIPGETVWFGLSFEMDDEWHIYWKNAGDAGIPPRAYWDDQTTVDAEAIGEIDWPLPELLPVVEGEIMDYGYSGTVVLPFPVTIPAGTDDADVEFFAGELATREDVEAAAERTTGGEGAAFEKDTTG